MKRSALYFSIICIILFSCQSSEDIKLKGHWHSEVNTQENRPYSTFDFVEDSLAILDYRSFFGEKIGRIYPKNQTIKIKSHYSIFDIHYKRISDDQILLNYAGNSEVYNRCDSTCCNPYVDVVKNLKVNIQLEDDLPNQLNTNKLSLDSCLFIFWGYPKPIYQKSYGRDLILQMGVDFSTIYTIPYYVESMMKKWEVEEEKDLTAKIIADKSLLLSELLKTTSEFQKVGINKIYFSIGFDPNEKKDDGFIYLNINDLEGSNLDINIEEYLNSIK